MARDYMPYADEKLRTWLENFAGVATQRRSALGLSETDVELIQRVTNDFVEALRIAKDPGKGTRSATCLKNELRRIAKQVCQLYSQNIRHNAGVDNDAKIALGIKPINTARHAINVPASAPVLYMVGATHDGHTLRFADSQNPEGPIKPFGVWGVVLCLAIADEPVKDPEQTRLQGIYTRSPLGVPFEHKHSRQIATYFARWASRREGQMGPWSAPVSMTIA